VNWDADGDADGDADDDERARYLAATTALDADDPDVVRFARRHDRSRRSDSDRAEGLRAAVHRHIDRKGMATAFATAGETVRTRAGDCTEHAVLLAAALRAVGIPSRTVSGLVWTRHDGAAGGAFLWHMWTQAVIDDQWVDLDATLPGGRSFHPGHLAVAVSDGSSRDIESSGRAMLAVFGSLGIEVQGEAGAAAIDDFEEAAR
jgi:transglutaminase-like putative cysteine protease